MFRVFSNFPGELSCPDPLFSGQTQKELSFPTDEEVKDKRIVVEQQGNKGRELDDLFLSMDTGPRAPLNTLPFSGTGNLLGF